MPTWITGGVVPEPVVVAYSETESGSDAKVTLRCAWADRHDTIDNIFTNEIEWPYWPESGWIPTAFTIKPTQQIRTTDAGDLNAYLTADLELTFSLPGGDNGNGEVGSPGGGSEDEVLYYETYQPSGEMLKLPPRLANKWQFRWGQILSNSVEVTNEEAPTRLIIGLDYVIRWVGLETVPEAFFDAPDHVNSNSVSSSAGKTFAPGTLLCQSPVISRTVTTSSAPPTWDVEARFSYRKDGWNKFWSPQHGEFRQIYKFVPPNTPTGVLYENFPSYDFTPMLP